MHVTLRHVDSRVIGPDGQEWLAAPPWNVRMESGFKVESVGCVRTASVAWQWAGLRRGRSTGSSWQPRFDGALATGETRDTAVSPPGWEILKFR